MPVIIAALWAAGITALRTWLPSIVMQILIAFGIGAAVQTLAMPAMKDFVLDYLLDLPEFWQQVFAALWIDIAFTMVISAAATVMGTRVFLRKTA